MPAEAIRPTAAGREARRDCPLCGSAASDAFTTRDTNRAVTGRRFDYRRCESCRSLFIAEVPDDLGRYYPPAYYELPAAGDLDAAVAAEQPKLDLVRAHVRGGRLVEVGPGPGRFALAAKRAGFDVTAIEMDERATEFLSTELGIEAIRSDRPEETLATLPPSAAIVLWHVIEHLPGPWEVVAAAARNLEPGGVLAISSPNPDALQFRLLGVRWTHVDAPRHVHLIPVAALLRRAREEGLEPLLVTTDDTAGRHWNRFGWERALGRSSAGDRSPRLVAVAARAVALALRPLERTRGATWTAVLRKAVET